MSPSHTHPQAQALDTERLFRVAVWMYKQHLKGREATVKAICDTFSVSRATAFRYRAAMRRILPPEINHGP